MIKVSVLYPAEGCTRFDHDYYRDKHMALVQERVGGALKRAEIDRGVDNQPYVALGHLYFESVEAFQAAFAPHGAEIMGDIPNYTDVQPVLQISEVVQ